METILSETREPIYAAKYKKACGMYGPFSFINFNSLHCIYIINLYSESRVYIDGLKCLNRLLSSKIQNKINLTNFK